MDIYSVSNIWEGYTWGGADIFLTLCLPAFPEVFQVFAKISKVVINNPMCSKNTQLTG